MPLNQESLENLLVVVDNALSMPQLLEKAERLAGPDTNVHVVQVIYEGVAEVSTAAVEDSSRLKTFMLQSAEAALEDELEKARGRFRHLESATLWNSRPWEAVLHAAADAGADLIVKATGEEDGFGERVARALRTPDEWNLLRHSPVPVLLVKVTAWPAEPLVLCAVDAFDEAHDALSVKLLGEAAQVAALLKGSLDVIFTYPLFEPWVGELGAVKSYAEIKETVEAEARSRIDELARQAGVAYRHLHLEEGQTAQTLARIVADDEAALVVMGTHAREGFAGVLLGNTSERILHAVDCDILTVHG